VSQTICKSNTIDFSSKNNFSNYLTIDYNSNNVINKDGVLSLRLDKEKGGTRVTLNDKLRYGKVDVKMKIAKGSNIVSSFILLAKNGDEIDFEFVQNNTNPTDLVQTNYFYRGIPIYDKNAKMYHTKKILSNNFHTYSLKWDPLYYEWYFDNFLLRRLYKNQTQNYPDSISSVQFGIWEASPSNWAGNGTDWSQKMFNFDISSIKVSCKNSSNIPSKTKLSVDSFVSKTKSFVSKTTSTILNGQESNKDIFVSNYPRDTPTSNSDLQIKYIFTQVIYITLINLLLMLI
jgi:beta-glucanase (GH16 family)